MLALILAACTSPPANEAPGKVFSPVVTWTGAVTTTLPLETITWDGRLIFFVVNVSMNGEEGAFMVDSGSNVTWLTDEFSHAVLAKGLVVASRQATINGVGGAKRQNTVLLDSLDLGFARLHPVLIATGDTLRLINATLAKKKERPLAGILGLNLLVPLGASLDLQKSTITFQKLPQPEPTKSSVTREQPGRS